MFEDFPFYYEGVLKSNTYDFVGESLITHVRNRASSTTNSKDLTKIANFYDNMSLLINLYNETQEDLKDALFDAILREHHNIEYFALKLRETQNEKNER